MPALIDEYELVLMLDPEAPDERRDQIAADARQRIQSGGDLKHDTTWGMRKLAYEINRRTEADYRFFRFEAGGPPLLDELNHNLKIADGVLRFRIFKVDPRLPVIVPPPPTPLSSGRPERSERGDRGRRDGRGGRGDGPRGGGGADDEPVAAPVAPVETPEPAAAAAPPAEAPRAEPAPAASEAPAPEAPAAEPAAAPAEPAPAEPAAEEAPASDDEQA